MASLQNTNILVHLGPGIFQTHGGITWRPKDGWTIHGAGLSVTTVIQTAILPSQFQVIGGLINDLEVSDLTIDCNYINLSPTLNATIKSIGAVSAISGHFNNVNVVHAGGTVETFTLGFSQYGDASIPPGSVLIENCQVTQSGPNVTAIYAANSQTNDNSDSVPLGGQATIRACYVQGTGNLTTAGIAFQINGYKSGLIDNCSTDGCKYSIYRDTLPQTGLTITNCNVNGLVDAIGLVGAPTDNVLISGNTLAAGEIIVITSGATHVTIQNNLLLPGPNYNNYWQPIKTTNSSNILNNQLSTGVLNGSGVIPLGKISGNKYTDGRNVPFLPDN